MCVGEKTKIIVFFTGVQNGVWAPPLMIFQKRNKRHAIREIPHIVDELLYLCGKYGAYSIYETSNRASIDHECTYRKGAAIAAYARLWLYVQPSELHALQFYWMMVLCMSVTSGPRDLSAGYVAAKVESWMGASVAKLVIHRSWTLVVQRTGREQCGIV